MRLDPGWIRKHVVRVALERIGLWSEAAEVLVTGTAICESNLTWLRQFGTGPARGLWQMEPPTAKSLWVDLLSFRPELAADVLELVGEQPVPSQDWRATAAQLEPYLVAYPGATSAPALFWYSAAMARVRYLWDRHPLPVADDPLDLARCWKRAYNTHLGAGTIQKATTAMEEAIRCL